MLTILGNQHTLCDGITRRNFLRIGGLGAGLTLADLLRSRAKASQRAPSARSVILVWMCGGPPQMDTYDLKPDSPVEFRGEFKPIPTNVPGVQISEHFPQQARMWDQLAVVRSVIPADGGHSDAGVSTGYSEEAVRREHRPSIGSVISRVRGGSNAAIPPYVSLRGLSSNLDAGFLGMPHRPFIPSGPGIDNLRLAKDVTSGRLKDRGELLSSFDTLRRDIDATGTMAGLDAFTTRAYDMITSGAVHNALDLKREDPRCRERYQGIEPMLTARRLVEAGVGCVTVSIGGSVWDTHFNNFTTLKKAMPEHDRAMSTLIQDLHDRGMENDVVTVVAGEFGRTARINKDAGRDHWSPVMSVLMAGGGLKMGQMIGATDARGEYPKDRPYRLQQVFSTVYQTLGIDPAMTFPNGSGRPMYLLDDREPIAELL